MCPFFSQNGQTGEDESACFYPPSRKALVRLQGPLIILSLPLSHYGNVLRLAFHVLPTTLSMS